MSAEIEVDKFGISCLLGILNQGLVSPIPVVQHLERTAPKLRNNIKKSLVSFVQQFYPEESRIHTLDSEAETMTVLRMIATQRPRSIKWREQHPYLLAEQVEFEEQEGEMGILKVTGVARGTPFNANRLVHLQNYGDFQIDKVRTKLIVPFDVELYEMCTHIYPCRLCQLQL
jgi:pre-rRNA-processing protein TSR1